MDEKSHDNRLHLPSLSITGFRGIDALTIERLGRVTLLAGKNSVGKTTVLDAVQFYAANGRCSVLPELLMNRGDVASITYTTGKESLGPHLEALFHGRDASQGAVCSIGPNNDPDQLRAEVISTEGASLPDFGYPGHFFLAPPRAIKIVFQGKEKIFPWYFSPYEMSTKMANSRRVYQYASDSFLYLEHNLPEKIACFSMGPERLNNDEIVAFWDVIALTDDEHRVVAALHPILGDQVERIGLITDDSFGRQVVAKFRGQPFPVPLETLGDGVLRLFGLALVLVNSRDGFLLIDEAENGIHHSIQGDFWRLVLLAAQANNVQVIATTHSFDCVRGFAQAIAECEGIEGVLVRIEREEGRLRAVEYSERNLKAAAESRIEVR